MSVFLLKNDQQLSDECFHWLKVYFGSTLPILDIKLLSPSDGRNSERHIKVLVGEQWFGFKTYPEAMRKSEDPRKYAEQDFLISKIAESVVFAPNACPMRQVTHMEHSLFKGWPVNIVQWLPESATFDKVEPSLVQSFGHEPYKFFFEFGQWLAFGLAMGVQDRRVDQFVCSKAGRISMIDMDHCFVDGETSYQNYVEVLQIFQADPERRLSECGNRMKEGMNEMNGKIVRSQDMVLDLLQSALYSDSAARWNPLSNISVNVDEVTSAALSVMSK